MRRKILLSSAVIGLGTLVSLGVGLVGAGDRSFSSVNARLSPPDSIVVRAAGRGIPFINLTDGVELAATYDGASEMQRLLEQNAAEPRALASADFDEDGVPDLICGYARAGGGIITLYRGNVDSIFPNSPEAQRRKAEGNFTDSAFLSRARVFEAPIAADFVGAGDFDADGHWDVVLAARGGNELCLLRGDGTGNFRSPGIVALPGGVTSFATGEINRADGLTDVVVGVVGSNGAEALVFEGPEGALGAKPEVFSMPAEPAALALGQFDDDYPMDLVVGAGSDLVVISGRDRKLSLDEVRQAEVPPAGLERRSFGFQIRAIATGNFTGGHDTKLALLASDGTVYLSDAKAQPARVKGKKGKLTEPVALGQFRGASQSLGARVSTGPADDLLVLNNESRQLHIVRTGNSGASATTLPAPGATETLDVDSEPRALLPMRLNADALSDLVVLQSGSNSPSVVKTTAAMTFIVNNADDHDDGMCDSGDCTLREALNSANTSAGVDTIAFNIPGSGVQTITPASSLPTIIDPVTIDCSTQPGFAGNPLVELNGSRVFGNGLTINAGSTTVRGLIINRFKSSGSFDGRGLLLTENGNNMIEGNFVGTDGNGTAALGNQSSGIAANVSTVIGGTTSAARNIISGNVGDGIGLGTGSAVQGNYIGTDVTGTVPLSNCEGVGVVGSNNTVGGATAGARNVVSGNAERGIVIFGSNTVQGNYVGTNATGDAILFNNGSGVECVGMGGAMIGGTTPAARNVISGNKSPGILLHSPGNMVQGNYIGTDATGTLGLPNQSGVFVEDSSPPNLAPGNIIGGIAAGASNLLSGNGFAGIVITSTETLVQGNLIGTDKSGSTALGNGEGILLFDGSNNTIGGTAIGARNVISGNSGHGIEIDEDSGETIQGNLIGTDISGTQPIGNSLDGIRIFEGSNNTIGGTSSEAGNTIAFNGRNGISVIGFDSPRTRNPIRRNSILSNSGLGIDLGDNGATLNDACDVDIGPNNLQNFPVLTSATSNGFSTRIEGLVNSTGDTTFTIEFFANPACDPSGFGEGQTFIGSASVTTDGSCNASFDVTLPLSIGSGQFITATATDPAGNTSEFSQCVQVTQGPSLFDICIQDDSGRGILNLNSATGDYLFTNCNGFTLTGTGVLTTRGGIITIQHNATDRRLLARLDTAANKGTATIQLFSPRTTLTLADRNLSNNACSCSGQT